jgi:hypothetical protein
MGIERKGGKPAASEERQIKADNVQSATIEAGKRKPGQEPKKNQPGQTPKGA